MSPRVVSAPEALAEIRVKGPVYVRASIFPEDLSWTEAKKEDLRFLIREAQEARGDHYEKFGSRPWATPLRFRIWRKDGGLYLTPYA